MSEAPGEISPAVVGLMKLHITGEVRHDRENGFYDADILLEIPEEQISQKFSLKVSNPYEADITMHLSKNGQEYAKIKEQIPNPEKCEAIFKQLFNEEQFVIVITLLGTVIAEGIDKIQAHESGPSVPFARRLIENQGGFVSTKVTFGIALTIDDPQKQQYFRNVCD